jgi:hypothetical protein
VKKSIGFYPCPDVDTTATAVVSHAGTLLLTETIRRVGLDRALSTALEPWRPRLAVHDPAKVLLDLALALAVGGDCLSDIALLRAEPALFGLVASDPTVSRTVDRLAADATATLAAIDVARAAARAKAWALADESAPDHSTDAAHPLVIDVDATLVTAHSDKQGAAPTFKRGFGHHPLWAFCDHGPDGTGEPLAALLRPGNAGSNTAADHITVIRAALRQLPGHRPGNRAGRKVLIRIDGAGASHELLDWLAGQRLSYSVGFGLSQHLVDQLAALPASDWQTALDAEREPRPGAWVIEATGLMNLSSWPKGMRVIVRRERPHPGAQLRFIDRDGLRYTAFATNTLGLRARRPDVDAVPDLPGVPVTVEHPVDARRIAFAVRAAGPVRHTRRVAGDGGGQHLGEELPAPAAVTGTEVRATDRVPGQGLPGGPGDGGRRTGHRFGSPHRPARHPARCPCAVARVERPRPSDPRCHTSSRRHSARRLGHACRSPRSRGRPLVIIREGNRASHRHSAGHGSCRGRFAMAYF